MTVRRQSTEPDAMNERTKEIHKELLGQFPLLPPLAGASAKPNQTAHDPFDDSHRPTSETHHINEVEDFQPISPALTPAQIRERWSAPHSPQVDFAHLGLLSSQEQVRTLCQHLPLETLRQVHAVVTSLLNEKERLVK
jgi:hypothetical protein